MLLQQLEPVAEELSTGKTNFNVPFKYTAFKRCQKAISKAASKDCPVSHNLLLLRTTVK